jgi:hypothetical protein
LRKMPPGALRDLTEWPPLSGKDSEVLRAFDGLLQSEISIETMVAVSPDTPSLTDDRPINEYYALRRWNWR